MGTSCSSCTRTDILCRDGVVHGTARRIRLHRREGSAGTSRARAREAPLSVFDAVLMRKDPPFDMEYVYSTYLLELAESQGARIVNRPRALRDYNEKFSITRFAAVHRAYPGHPAGARDPGIPRRAGRHRCSSRSTAWAARRCSAWAARTPTSSVDHRDADPATAAARSWRSATSRRSSRATSASS